MNDPKPEPAKVLQAVKNTDNSMFKETHPHTQELEDVLSEQLNKLHKERERILQEGKDVNLAIATIGDHLDAIQKAKKPS